MDTKSIKKVPCASKTACSNSILTEWIKTSSFFYANYKTLSTYLSAHTDLQATDSLMSSACIGRCSVEELITFLTLMRQELITLVTDMNSSVSGKETTPHIDEQLATHITRLNRLNRRAQTMISLLAN